MRRSEAARYARWSAAVALLLACITAGVYIRRGWQRHSERKTAPPPPPVNVEKQSSGLTFSKMDGPRKIFTVEASKSTDFKDQNASLLENVKVTIFGKAGDRHDTIHTQTCQYGKEKSAILCAGAVQIDLQSAADAENASKNLAALAQVVHIETSGVNFDNSSGGATTGQPVTFTFPNGSGDAVGAEYNSAAGTLRLLQAVHLNLKPGASKNTPPRVARTNPDEVVHVTGNSLDFGRDARILHISGPAEAQSATAHLTAGEFTLELDAMFRARRLLALPNAAGKPPELTSQTGVDTMNVIADKLTAEFSLEGWVTRMEGQGSVYGGRKSKEEDDEFHAAAATLDMWPRLNQARELNLNGGVLLKTHVSTTGDARTLRTGALRMAFNEPKEGQSAKPIEAETLTAGTMEWTDSSSQTRADSLQPPAAPIRTKLQADKLRLAFGPEGKPSQLDANGHVQTERALPGHPLQTATAKTGVAQLLASGGWSQMDLQDDVKLKEADRNARSDHATFVRLAQTALLTGRAVVRDSSTETHAPRILFYQSSGDIRAEGGVRSTDFSSSANGNSTQTAQVPANICSDTLQANSQSGRALYSGHARLWQGDSVLEADSIELLRESKILNASGGVRAVFPQTSASSPANDNPSAARRASEKRSASSQLSFPSDAKKPVLWHVTAGTLTYNDLTSTAHLEKDVVIQSADQHIRAPEMDLYFTHASPSSNSPANTASTNVTGAHQINRAIGSGGVIVEEGGRRATADHGEYTASDGKFVMTGGTPTLYDGIEGTTTGRQLTFFLADDTIIVDSEHGSRTLTKHRVNASQ